MSAENVGGPGADLKGRLIVEQMQRQQEYMDLMQSLLAKKAKKPRSPILSVATFILLVPSMLWSAYALQTIWAWFVVPIFHLPELTLVQILGLHLVHGAITFKPSNEDPDDFKFDAQVNRLIRWAFVPGAILGYGWVLTRFL